MNKNAALALIAAAQFASCTALPALAGSYPVGGSIPFAAGPAPTPVVHTVIAPTAVVAPFVAPIATPVAAPVSVPLPPTATNTFVQPKDITYVLIPGPTPQVQSGLAMGVKQINEELVTPKVASSSGDFVLVRGDSQSKFQRLSSNTVKLEEGSILVSVRRPSRLAVIETADGLVALNADSDALITYSFGVLRVANISARNTDCRIKISKDVIDGKSRALALAPGYELVASDQKLLHNELRPADGIARRKLHVFADSHLAVNEFRVASVLTSSSVIASILGNMDNKEHRVLTDMCKMAAVLDFVHGSGGYHATGSTGIAGKPGADTH